jgi:hypothetical protein
VPSPDSRDTVEGLLLNGIKPEEWRLLDDFEDDIYDLVPLDLLDGRTGWAYVCQDNAIAQSARWDYHAFAHDDLPTYVGRCRAWRARRSERQQGDRAS